MNKIKMLILGLGIFFGSTVFAQEHKRELTKEQRMEQRMDKFGEELELTEKQKEQVIDLRKTSYAERQRIKADESLNEETRKEAMKENRLKSKEQMAEILTEEQALKLKTMKEERRENYKKNNPNKEYKGKRKEVKKEHRMKRLEVEPLEK